MGQQTDFDKMAGAAIKEARLAGGLSQEALAAEANVDQSMLSKVERLGPASISWAKFCHIAATLGYGVELRLVRIGQSSSPPDK